MKRETLFLKIAVFLMGLPILALCIFGVPSIAKGVSEFLGMSYVHYPVLIVLYATAAAFFLALYQAYRLLSYIDKNKAFSDLSVTALKNIKYCAITISGFYVLAMPLFYLVAEYDDAPGVIVIGLVIIFGSMVIAVFAAVLQKLLRTAIDIKSENDLTV
ncbi:Protein of unknown function [Thalassobacillus cyri]|uniref:DUF2975 domain-containing protein n=1 Tax=Thalassobacillus cyri TaxID=571932 RepID=A0A1H3VS21_9BACI|nr:DUF2975 domain-containing protein [Thalassobacillus cyri]SDZ77560.1 Protein of unknown function [Thalassobacillus cyri]